MPPIIILIRPQMGENIGAVARAMANFGLSELRLVAPRDGWPNPQAEAMAAGAGNILTQAKLYDDVASALADVTRAYATTARPRELQKRVVVPAEAISEMTRLPDDQMTKMALVFGPERTGLTNEDLSWCESIVCIPTSPDYSSLNLAQSMVVMGYEWFKQSAEIQSTEMQNEMVATAPLEHYDQLFRRLEGYLDATDFFKLPEKKIGMWLNIKTMLLRGRFTEQEIRTLHGMLRALAEKRE